MELETRLLEIDRNNAAVVLNLTPYLRQIFTSDATRVDGRLVLIESPDYVEGTRARIIEEDVLRIASKVNLAIAGCTLSGEEEIRTFMGSGLVVGRFSIFYRNPSQYTGRNPEDAGYALDIPKDIGTVRRLLTSEQFIRALVERDETGIRDSLSDLNRVLYNPILATPYLTEALRIRR